MLGLAAAMLFLGIGLTIVRSIYLNSVPTSVLPSDAAAVLFDTLVRFLRQGLRVVGVVALVIAAAAFFIGPSAAAVRSRRAVRSGIDWVRTLGERAGLRTGPVGEWTGAHKTILRVGAVALVGIIFVFWGQPTVAVVIVARRAAARAARHHRADRRPAGRSRGGGAALAGPERHARVEGEVRSCSVRPRGSRSSQRCRRRRCW